MYEYVVLNSRKFTSDMSCILFISDVPQEIHHRTDVTIVMGFTADAFHQARASIFRKKLFYRKTQWPTYIGIDISHMTMQ